MPKTLVICTITTLALVASGCTTVLVRNPVPEESIETAAPYGISGSIYRVWGDEIGEDPSALLVENRVGILREVQADRLAAGRPIQETYLALSGGGPDGAFGAGLLDGWSERGDRPEFTVVTGISTGAILALYAFLGPEYDATLREIYTTYTTDQLLSPAIFDALLGGTAIADASGYRALIDRYIDDAIVEKLAAEAARGRVLLIGTTNIDASRPVTWNITGIAASGHPSAKRLIRDVVQASSAIPAAFPPVLIPVTLPSGRRYDEMHVDGGATQQVMLFAPEVPMKRIDDALGAEIDRTVYVVMNNKLDKRYEPVRPRLAAIAARSASSLLGGAGGGDIYKIYAVAARDEMKLNVLAIPKSFDLEASEPFDPVYMSALYKLGREIGVEGPKWSPTPPDFTPYP